MDNQHLSALIIKHFFILSNINLSFFSLKNMGSAQALQALLARLSPSFLQDPFIYWKDTVRSPLSLLQAEQLSILSGLLHRKHRWFQLYVQIHQQCGQTLYPDVLQRYTSGDTKNSDVKVPEWLDIISFPGWKNIEYVTCLKPESSTYYSATGKLILLSSCEWFKYLKCI